jgi:hypothetical protein
MRIAVTIISLVLMLIIGFQSFAAYGLGSVVKHEAAAASGAAGLAVSFLYLLGGAFALGVPVLSVIALLLAGLFARVIAGDGLHKDMYIWGWIAWMLAGLEFVSILRARKRKSTSEGAINQ